MRNRYAPDSTLVVKNHQFLRTMRGCALLMGIIKKIVALVNENQHACRNSMRMSPM